MSYTMTLRSLGGVKKQQQQKENSSSICQLHLYEYKNLFSGDNKMCLKILNTLSDGERDYDGDTDAEAIMNAIALPKLKAGMKK